MATDAPSDAQASTNRRRAHLGWFLLALFALLALMAWSASGTQSLDLKFFVIYWLRELLILGFLAGVFIVIGIGKLRRQDKQG
jgi:peptidoglycan/LPS O-acetylase OafA/YrhL